MCVRDRMMQRCFAVSVPCVRVGSGFEEGIDDVEIVVHRPIQRGGAVLVPCVRVGPGLKASGHLFGCSGFEKLPGVPVTAVGPGRRSGRGQEATPENGNGRFHGAFSSSTELTGGNCPRLIPTPEVRDELLALLCVRL